LFEVDTAATATPLEGSNWQLEQGRYWHATSAGQGTVLSTQAAGEEIETPFDTRQVTMVLDPRWLHNLGLSPQYLYLEELQQLAGAQIMSRDLSGYRTRLQMVFGETLFTCAMAIFGAALSMIYFAYQTRWFALVTVLLAGYMAHFASKAFQLMAEFGYIPPVFGGWLASLLLILAVLWAVFVIQKRRGLGATLADTPQHAIATSG
jgi:lipopolysaccharide export LptBFGC system permease protein LptF